MLKGSFVFLIESGEYLRFLPGDGAVVAVASVFRDTRYVFIMFLGCNVVVVLFHACLEINAGLTDVFGARVAAASKLVNSFLVVFWRTSFVVAAEDVS